ncbi:MAG: type III pantothenate kinase [Lentisphaeria bacterium]|nr:type III pantothenate kinase [Lentisphaeria bacterium]
MIEILDIGNSFTRIALWDGIHIRSLRRVATADFSGTAGDLPAVAACVCPDVKKRLAGENIEFISAVNHRSAVDFSAVNTATLGADRVANAIALAELYDLPGVVIDCGTAVTMEVVDADKRFRGGAIAPGRKLMRQALHCGTGQLPEVPLYEKVPELPGCNTPDAISFGIDRGIIGMVREFVESAARMFPLKSVVLTGGDAGFLAFEFPDAIIADEFFTLTGIRIGGGY